MSMKENNPYGMKFIPERTELYRKQGYWGNATLLDSWNFSVLRHPDKAAIIDSHGAALTFGQADDEAARVARVLLDIGVKRGDVVSLQLPGWVEFLPIYIGCMKAGAVVNPIPPNLRYQELLHILSTCESKVIFAPCFFRKFSYDTMLARLCKKLASLHTAVVVHKGDAPAPDACVPSMNELLADAAPLPKTEVDKLQEGLTGSSLAAVMFTSGSEGEPKGVMLTHDNILSSEEAFAAHLAISQFDVMLMPAPITHATGFHHGVTMPFMVGATSVVQDVFCPEQSLELIEKYRCTVSMASPPFLYDMLRVLPERKFDLGSLRYFLCGGAPVDPIMMERALAAGINTSVVYGSTESVPHVACKYSDILARRGDIGGVGMPGIEVKSIDRSGNTVGCGEEGEELSRGPQVTVGYMKHPELTEKALDDEGWFHSGDLCLSDAEGLITITGRLKDMIIRGGENISSLEVENILLRHPDIREVAVVGMPDPRLTERACAYVVLEDGAKSMTMQDMVEFLSGQDISKFKFPERLELLKEFPRTASGKIRKGILRKEIAAKIMQEA